MIKNKRLKIHKQKFLKALGQCGAMFALAVFFGFSINQVQDNRLPVFGDGSMRARLTSSSGERLDISLAEAKNLFLRQPAIFIDSRSNDDFTKGHIKGARNLPLHEVDRRFMKVTEDISTDTPIITYCDGEACNLSLD
ncbi:MAG: rhodanese-like domain-containing protein, partial [Desulfobacterales bacterium]